MLLRPEDKTLLHPQDGELEDDVETERDDPTFLFEPDPIGAFDLGQRGSLLARSPFDEETEHSESD